MDASKQVTSKKAQRWQQYAVTISVSFGTLGAGTVLAWTGNISEDLKNLSYNGIEIDDDILGWIGSLASLGAVVACIPVGKLCDVLGRKLTLLILVIPFLLGWCLIIFSYNLAMLYVGRFFSGLYASAFSSLAIMYVSEISEKSIRGRLTSGCGMMMMFGIVFAYTTATFVDIKVYTIILAVIPILFTITFIFQPESPVFAVGSKNDEKAREILRRLRGSNYDIDVEIKDIAFAVQQQQSDTTFLQYLKQKNFQKAFVLCSLLMFFQQANGVNAIIYYSESIFASTNSSLDHKIATIIIGLLQFLGGGISVTIIDRLGRRIILFASIIGMGLCTVVMGAFFTLKDRGLIDPQTLSTLDFLPVISLSIYMTLFGGGIGPLAWIIPGELLPPGIKGLGTGALATINGLLAFLISKYYLNLNNLIGGDVTFYIFSAISFLGGLFIYFFIPETQGKTLHEIQIELGKKS